MKNTFINNYRRRIHFNIINKNDGLYLSYALRSDVTLDPASILESKQLEKDIEPNDYKLRIPFKMRCEGYKYKEIAEILV